MQAVKIRGLLLHGVDTEHAPSKIRLFVNPLDSLDFDSAKDEKPTQELELSASDVSTSAKALELRYVLFQNVQSLAIFIPANHGDEETTRVSKLAVFDRFRPTFGSTDCWIRYEVGDRDTPRPGHLGAVASLHRRSPPTSGRRGHVPGLELGSIGPRTYRVAAGSRPSREHPDRSRRPLVHGPE